MPLQYFVHWFNHKYCKQHNLIKGYGVQMFNNMSVEKLQRCNRNSPKPLTIQVTQFINSKLSLIFVKTQGFNRIMEQIQQA